MKTKYATKYTNSTGSWTTDTYDVAIAMAGNDARRDNRLFSEVYDKTTNMVIGYASYDGKEL